MQNDKTSMINNIEKIFNKFVFAQKNISDLNVMEDYLIDKKNVCKFNQKLRLNITLFLIR